MSWMVLIISVTFIVHALWLRELSIRIAHLEGGEFREDGVLQVERARSGHVRVRNGTPIPAGAEVTITLRAPGGDEIARAIRVADVDGYWDVDLQANSGIVPPGTYYTVGMDGGEVRFRLGEDAGPDFTAIADWRNLP